MPAPQAPTWVAFIDLLGTKESSALSNEDLFRSQARFQDFIVDYSSILSPSDSLHPFADCCYIEFSDVREFVEFYQKLRYQLFGLGFFFKCAVGPGQLGYQRKNGRQGGATVQGGSFGPGVVSIYKSHETFKGVGITVEKPSSTTGETYKEAWDHLSTQLVRSCHPSGKPTKVGAAELIEYFDIVYSPAEVGKSDASLEDASEAKSYVRGIFRKAFESKIKNLGYGKYYLSAIIAMANSSDFSAFEYDDGRWSKAPPVFDELFSSTRRIRAFSDIPGIEIAYYTCLQKIREVLDEEDFRNLVIRLAKEQWLIKRISRVPSRFLDHKSRTEILSVISEHGLS